MRTRTALALAALALLAPAALAQPLEHGDVIIFRGYDTPARIDVGTGALQSFSAPFSNPGALADMVFETSGALLVTNGASLFRVDRLTGAQTPLASGISPDIYALAAANDGGLFGLLNGGAVVRINPVTGARTPLTSGNLLANGLPGAMAFEPATGAILVAVTVGNDPRIVRVNPATGAQALVAHGGSMAFISDVAVAEDSGILVVDGAFRIVRIDPVGGQQTVLPLQPPPILEAGGFTAIAADPSGAIYVGGTGVGPSGVVSTVVRYFANGTNPCPVWASTTEAFMENSIAVFDAFSCPGDANRDSKIDFLDLNIVLSAYGSACP